MEINLSAETIGAMVDRVTGIVRTFHQAYNAGTAGSWSSWACGPWLSVTLTDDNYTPDRQSEKRMLRIDGKAWSLAFDEVAVPKGDEERQAAFSAANDNYVFAFWSATTGEFLTVRDPIFDGDPDACLSDLSLVKMFVDERVSP